MAKRGAKPKKVKGEMIWVPDYLISVVKKIKETDMTKLKERFAMLNAGDRAITIGLINTGGIKLLSDLFVYRDHLVIPTATPDQSLFGFKVITVINGEEIGDLNLHECEPQSSLEAAIIAAKLIIDSTINAVEDYIASDGRGQKWDEFFAITTDSQLDVMADQVRQDIADDDSHDS
jgi:hypothetical protein